MEGKQAMGIRRRVQRGWCDATLYLAAFAILVQSLLQASDPKTTATEASREESLLRGHGVKPTTAGLRGFLQSFQEDRADRPDAIQRLIEQLGSDDFAEREAAGARLLVLPVSPVKELTAALENPDAEIRLRARTILDQVRRRAPRSVLLFASLLVIRDRERSGFAADVLRAVPHCDSKPLRSAAEQAMHATVHSSDRALLQRALAADNCHARSIAAIGLAKIDAKAEPGFNAAAVTWVEFLDTFLVRGQYNGERTEFLKGVPASLAMHFEQVTRTANTIDAVVNRHGTAAWLYPVRGKNEIPRPFVEADRKHYPIQGTWRQHWTQWIVLDENGKTLQGGPAQGSHSESRVDFLVVPLPASGKPRPAR